MQISQTLKLIESNDKRLIACSKCEHRFGSASENWKQDAILHEQPIHTLGETYTVDEKILIRTFVCPDCGVLLDTEVALADDPFLQDIIY